MFRQRSGKNCYGFANYSGLAPHQVLNVLTVHVCLEQFITRLEENLWGEECIFALWIRYFALLDLEGFVLL